MVGKTLAKTFETFCDTSMRIAIAVCVAFVLVKGCQYRNGIPDCHCKEIVTDG